LGDNESLQETISLHYEKVHMVKGQEKNLMNAPNGGVKYVKDLLYVLGLKKKL